MGLIFLKKYLTGLHIAVMVNTLMPTIACFDNCMGGDFLKNCWKRRNFYLSAFSPFPKSVFKPLTLFKPYMPILGSLNSTANKDMISKIWTNGDTVIC